MAREKVEEKNVVIFNKRLNRLLSKARIQDSACDLPHSYA